LLRLGTQSVGECENCRKTVSYHLPPGNDVRALRPRREVRDEKKDILYMRFDESDDPDASGLRAPSRVRARLLALLLHGFDEILRRLGLMEFTISGNKLAAAAEVSSGSWPRHRLPGKNRPYDLVVTCSDVYLQKNIRNNRIVLVQEGITDPESMMFHLVKRLRFLPLWWRVHRRPVSAMRTGLSASQARDIAIFSSERRAPREDRRHGNTQFR
jgi:hypothetical protein